MSTQGNPPADDQMINPLFTPLGLDDDDDAGTAGDPPAGDPPAGDPPAGDPPAGGTQTPPQGEPAATAPPAEPSNPAQVTPFQMLEAYTSMQNDLSKQFGEHLTADEIQQVMETLKATGEQFLPGFKSNGAHLSLAKEIIGNKFLEGKIQGKPAQRAVNEPAMVGGQTSRTPGDSGLNARQREYLSIFGDALGDKAAQAARFIR